MKVNATKQEMRPLLSCPCKDTEETATQFCSTVQFMKLRTAKNINLYDLRDCVNLAEFIRTSGRDVSSNQNIILLSSVN